MGGTLSGKGAGQRWIVPRGGLKEEGQGRENFPCPGYSGHPSLMSRGPVVVTWPRVDCAS